MTTVGVPKDLLDRVTREAEARMVNRTQIVAWALAAWLDEHEGTAESMVALARNGEPKEALR